MKSTTVIAMALALVAGFALYGCDGDSLGGALSDLNGEYKIPGEKCWIKVAGSKITAVGGDGQAPCFYEEDDGDEWLTRTLTVDGTISENRVTGALTYEEVFDYHHDGCTIAGEYSHTLELDVSKTKGRSSSGRFAVLAGNWEGTLGLVESLYEDQSGADHCDSWEINGTSLYEIEADVKGDEAEIEYSLEDGDDEGDFEVEVASDDELEIDGEEIEIR